jgi:hypothetical protein
MKARLWLSIAAIGFCVMLVAFSTRFRPNLSAPWSEGLLIVGPQAAGQKGLPGRIVPARMRLLSGPELTERVLSGFSVALGEQAFALEAQLRPKLIVLSLPAAGIQPKWLLKGRLPKAGASEALAGSKAQAQEALTIDDRRLVISGILKPDVALLAHSYVVPQSPQGDALVAASHRFVHDAALVELTHGQLQDHRVTEQFEKAFPAPKFATLAPPEWLDRRTFYLYLAGQALFLLGGSGALIGFYRKLADRFASQKPAPVLEVGPAGALEPGVAGTARAVSNRRGFLAAPLLELSQRPRLVWGAHLVYFGLVMASALVVYELPQIQAVLLRLVLGALASPSTPLGVAAKAYASGNILRAAAVTFVVNFFLGTLAVITLPSVVLPGSGAFVAAVRAVVWGLLLAPTFESNAFSMLPHSGTLLLEGEGYILAALFAALIPIYIVQSSLGGNRLSRFGRALLLNLKSNLLVALVLAVAALYEAIEVIALTH